MEKIKVEVRIKPNKSNVLEYTENRITVGSKTFTFSRVHSNISQTELYNSSVSPLISRFADGENCSVLAYGQTGSGKTYTIGIASHTEEKNDKEKAIIQYSLEAMFGLNLELSCTYIEIYNEAIIDLLGDSRSSLPLRQGMGEITIVGLKEVEVKTLEDALMLLNLGTEKRTTKSTKMNNESSRSHAIFTVILRKNVGNKVTESKMAFVDLAGSERLKRTECTGNRAKESISINTGLLSLGNVISALYHKQAHIPFRDSKLTRILETCLIGHVFLIACVSGQQEDMFETTNTLKYASRAALITLNTKVKIENDKDKLVVMRLKKEISKLKDEVQRLRGMMLKQENIRNHPFVIDLMNRLRKYEGGTEEEHEIMHQSITDSNSTEKSYGINGKSVHRQLAGLELEKLDLSQSDSETSMDSEKTVFYPSESIEKSSIMAENTLSNRIISPIKEEEASRNSKKRKRIVTFESSKKCIVSPPPKVYFKQVDTIFDASAVSMVIHNEQLFFNSTDSKIRHYDPVASKISIVVSDDGIKSLRSNKDLFYYTKSLLKIHTGQGKPLPVYAYRNEITSLEMKNSLVFSGHEDGTLCILDRRSNELVFSKKIHKGPIFDIKVISDGFYCAGRDCKISFGEMRDYESIRTVAPSHSDVVSALLSFKGKCISLSRDCSIKAWDRDRMVDSIPSAHKSWIRCGSTFNNFFITGCKGGSLRCWNFANDSLECIGKVDISMGINCILNCGNDLWVGCQNSNIYRYSLNID